MVAHLRILLQDVLRQADARGRRLTAVTFAGGTSKGNVYALARRLLIVLGRGDVVVNTERPGGPVRLASFQLAEAEEEDDDGAPGREAFRWAS